MLADLWGVLSNMVTEMLRSLARTFLRSLPKVATSLFLLSCKPVILTQQITRDETHEILGTTHKTRVFYPKGQNRQGNAVDTTDEIT